MLTEIKNTGFYPHTLSFVVVNLHSQLKDIKLLQPVVLIRYYPYPGHDFIQSFFTLWNSHQAANSVLHLGVSLRS